MKTNPFRKSLFLASAALCTGIAAPAWAQTATPQSAEENAEEAVDGNDILVVARRVEERLQDVPISITVLSEKTLANNNITSAKDIATFTPGLSTNNRFGSDNTTWTIRGFTQEQRTTATVGTYFADVVAPRGSGATQGGDGAGPGNLFDLANVQVLKGPQGTLQGRNSTGGAVLLVPKRPTDNFEGYVEGSLGNYDMRRVQGVINVPVSDTFKVRLGVDYNDREGYLQNAGRIGFGPHGDAGGSQNYIAGRASILWDISPDIENYTVVSFSNTKSTGVIPKITQAFYREPYSKLTGVAAAGTLDAGQNVSGLVTSNGLIALNQLAYEASVCGSNFWCVSNSTWDSRSESKTWQAINSTKVKVSDSLTAKAILSYGEFRGDTTLDLFGLYNPRGPAPANAISIAHFQAVATPLAVRNFAATRAPEGLHTNAQSSFVAELQLQRSGDRLNWQGGLYFERNNPLGPSGTAAPSQTPCGPIGAALPAGAAATEIAFQVDANQVCLATANQANSLGRVGFSLTENYFRDTAVYWQGIYELNDQLKVTAGIRYTWDTMRSDYQLANLRYYSGTINSGFNGVTLAIPGFNTTVPGLAQGVGFCANNVVFGRPTSTVTAGVVTAAAGYFPAADAANQCRETRTVKTKAPTWLLGLDYKPSDDVLLYAKYSRGYRQGGVASFGLDQLQEYGKETVDTFELGTKASWGGSVPGFFNLSAFHNNFRDQQLQIGVQCNPTANCPQTTVILNTGKSRLQGFEVETGIRPFKGFQLSASYAYLRTKLIDVVDVTNFVISRNPTLNNPPTTNLDLRPVPIGSPIPNAVPHKLVLSATYTFPFPDSVGKVSIGSTMVYTSAYRAVSDPPVLASCAFGPTGAPQTVNTNINLFNCAAANPAQFASEFGILPSSKVASLNVNWEGVAGLPVDAAFFMTNVTKAKTLLHANVQAGSGFISNIIGEPRMFGFRLKWRFGG